MTTGAQRLVDAAKQAYSEIGETVLDLQRLQRRLADARSQLGYAVSLYDGSATELPDEEPRD